MPVRSLFPTTVALLLTATSAPAGTVPVEGRGEPALGLIHTEALPVPEARSLRLWVGALARGILGRARGLDFDEETLRAIAAATGGQYYHATSGEKLAEIYSEIGRLEKTEVTSQVHLEYSELYALFLWPGFLALAGDFLLWRTRFRSLP